MSEEQKITNDIRVPNNDLEVLRKHFPQCFDKDGNFQLEKFKNNLSENEINFSTESYGLEWLGKSYARILASDSASTLLKADETHNNKPENANAENLLLKGDNLEVLKHLSNAYYEKVKMIYIDPPYNTGSDGFVYNDDRKFTVSELQNLIGVDAEKAKRILTFTQSNSNSHSAWLTFMYPRLYIAKQLLKDDGVIFVSIDDNEVAQLRLLMDEVFGEENFVADAIWRSKDNSNNDAKKFSVDHNHTLVYSKSTDWQPTLILNKSKQIHYKNPENDPKGPYFDGNPLNSPNYRENLVYDLISPNGVIIPPPKNGWRWSKEVMQEKISCGEIRFTQNEKNIRRRTYLQDAKGLPPSTLWIDLEITGHNRQAKYELISIIPEDVFDTPKPIKLLKYILELSSKINQNDIILDFFAGSGTTGDAIMQINAEDGGNRKFILVQLPEEIDKKKNKAAYDFVSNKLKAEPTIFEITKERLLRAAKKVNESIDKKNSSIDAQITKLEAEIQTDETIQEIKELKDIINQNLIQKTNNVFKIFETTPIWEDYDFDSKELDAQTKLFDESKLTENDIKALLTTWKTYDGIPLTQELEVVDLDAYSAFYGNGKLYLMYKGFSTENLKNILEKIDSDKSFDPKTVVAFGYHFESKNLRELAENLRNYKNKKGSDENISFITRY